MADTDDMAVPRLHRLLGLQLEQLTSILECADGARAHATAAYLLSASAAASEDKNATQADIKKRDKEYHDCLLLAWSIGTLCRSPAYQQSIRIARLQKLLVLCTIAADRYLEVTYVVVETPTSAVLRYWMRQLKLTKESLTLGWHLHCTTSPIPEPISVAEYLGYLPHRRRRGAQCLGMYNDTMVIEPYGQRVKTSTVDNEPIRIHPAMEGSRHYIDYGAVNAIWHALTTAGIFDKENKQAYLELSGTLFTAWSTEDKRCDEPEFEASWSPDELAIGLKDMAIDLGVFFEDDPSAVLWPLGKSHADSGRSITLYCADTFIKSRGGWCWRYRPLASGAGESDGGEAAVAKAASPGALVALNSLRGLPAEIRNRIYAAYLEPESEEDHWTSRAQYIDDINLPELCCVSRHFYEEVTPLWLASRSFDCTFNTGGNLGGNPGWRHVGSAMQSGNYCITHLRSHAHFQRLSLISPRMDWVVDIDLSAGTGAAEGDAAFVTGRFHSGRVRKALDVDMHSLRELIEILVEDNGTGGLSLADMEVIGNFVIAHRHKQ